MGTRNKFANTAQHVKGTIKATVGKVTGNKKLQRKGLTDQVASNAKNVGEDVKDATAAITDAATEK